MQNMAIEHLILIDIETVSCSEHYELLTDSWKELWTEKINRSLPENVTPAEYYPMRAGIMAEFAKVVCISMGFFRKENNSQQLRIKSFYSDDEKEVLEGFTQTLKQLQAANNKWCFTGHNIKEFDIPFLCRRLLVNNLPIPSFFDFQNMKPWETPVVDTLHLWRFGDYKHYTSLKLLAAALGVPSPKDDIDGSMVGHVYWSEKDLKRIAFYCQRDVATVANIMLRFRNLPLLTEEQIVYVT
ncbi:MAG: ribonuclease H-like domain-containing protein [Chitinophagaceae bacterium]|nr:ribonuclease H-like domain-containing protein [Chitinophagaceae bacterium]